jgi:RNA polymerase sigma factor (sigma-70 family)
METAWMKPRRPRTSTGLDAAAFLALYDREAERVLRFFVRRTLDPQAAADLTAETFVEALASRERFDSARGTPAAWLFGIARHQLGSFNRAARIEDAARRRLGVRSLALSPQDYERVESMIDFAEVGRVVRDALADLGSEHRHAVVLRVIDRLSYREVAARLGCSEEAARARVSRGLRSLAKAIAATGVEN